MPNPVPKHKQAIALTVGTLCAAASFVVLGGVTSAFSGSPVADTTESSVTAPTAAPTCPAGTTETADACERVVVSPAPARVAPVAAVAKIATEPTAEATTDAPASSKAAENEDVAEADDDTTAEPSKAPGVEATHESEHSDDADEHDSEQEHHDEGSDD